MPSFLESKTDSSLAVLLTENELNAFFPARREQNCSRCSRIRQFFPGATPPHSRPFLAEHQSEALLSGWSTPPLPQDLPGDLRYVCHLTGGVRALVPRPLMEAGLRVSNWGDGAAETVAENCLMLILAALRETQYWGREMHERGGWRTGYGNARTLFDRSVAIHGFGRIARALLPLLAPFRCPVSVYSDLVPPDYIRAHGAKPLPSLEALFACGADILVEIEALTPQSRGSVREAHLRSLKLGAVFVNSGRGAVVDEAALGQVAAEGDVQVALDVYAKEPLPVDSPLRGLPNVTLMPHMGGPTVDRHPAIGQFARENLRRWRAGEPLNAEIDLAIYDAST
jgi:phosphoglycerate dehydrogenase-like enzyme